MLLACPLGIRVNDMSDNQHTASLGMQGDGGQPAPKIEFPCDYSLKIVGDHDDGFQPAIVDVLKRFDSSFNETTMTHQDSRNGRFRSLRATIKAESEEQLKALFEALKATGRVHMVL